MISGLMVIFYCGIALIGALSALVFCLALMYKL